MQIFLYIIWFGIPAFFLLLALWSKLEQLSGKLKKENPGDFFKQGLFVLGCALVCLAIDKFILSEIDQESLPWFLPLLFIQIVLFPFILYAAALIIGPTKQIRIEKAARPSERVRR